MHYLGGHYFSISFWPSCSIDQKKGSSSYERLLRAYLGLGRIRTDQEKCHSSRPKKDSPIIYVEGAGT